MKITHAPVYQITGATPEQVIGMIAQYDRRSQRELLGRIADQQRRHG